MTTMTTESISEYVFFFSSSILGGYSKTDVCLKQFADYCFCLSLN